MKIIFGLSKDIDQTEVSRELLSHVNSKWDVLYFSFPESCLHPFKQRLVLREIMDSSNGKSVYIKTTSQVLIEEVAELIEKGVIESNKCLILLAEYQDSGFVVIKESNFDSEGYLQNWPIGFFSGY